MNTAFSSARAQSASTACARLTLATTASPPSSATLSSMPSEARPTVEARKRSVVQDSVGEANKRDEAVQIDVLRARNVSTRRARVMCTVA